MHVRNVEIIGVLPQTCAPSLSREQRTCKVFVSLAKIGLEGTNGFKGQFERETMIAPRNKREKPANRHLVQFTVRNGPSKLPTGTKAISPTEALSLSWLPKDWLNKQSAAEAEIVPIPTEEPAAEAAFASAEA